MQIVQTLETINVNTGDINVFQYFKDLITKNFTRVVGRKNKILSFFEENEIPQRRCFSRVLDQKYRKSINEGIENLQDTRFKTLRLIFGQNNMLKPTLFIKIDLVAGRTLMKLSSNEKLFITYIRNYSQDYNIEYNEMTDILILEYKNESTLELFEAFADESEHLKYYVDFEVDRGGHRKFHQNIRNEKNMKWKFNALAKLFSNYSNTLECTPQNDLSEIRQKYLILVRLYRPDFHQGKSVMERAYAREQFEKVQIAYDNLKVLYKNNIQKN